MSSSKLIFYPSSFSDRSMLEALGGPGERSILSQKRTTGNGDGEEEKDLGDGESQEDSGNVKEVQTKGENDESPGSHAAESVDEWSEGKAEKSEEDEEEEYEEKRANSVENSEESMTKDKKGKWIFSLLMYACLLQLILVTVKQMHEGNTKNILIR